MFETLTALAKPWADFYADHTSAATIVLSVHMLAMFLAGGMAIGADRAIVRAAPGSAEAARAVVADLSTTHSLVIGSLIVTTLSGVVLFLTDVPTFSVSKVYWTKMAAVTLLLLNGLRMRRAEGAVMHPLASIPLHTTEMPIAFPKKEWSAVRQAAVMSLGLWFTIVLLSVVLTNN